MNTLTLPRVESASSSQPWQATGEPQGSGSNSAARARKQNTKTSVAVFLSTMALLISGCALAVVLNYITQVTNASQQSSQPVGDAEVGQYFGASSDNSDKGSPGVIEPAHQGLNHLLQRYAMTQLLMGEDRQKTIDELLQIIENDVTANRSSITSAREFSEIIQASNMTKDDVTKLADQYEDEKNYVRSAILSYSASKMGPIPCYNHTSGAVQYLLRMRTTSERLVKTTDEKNSAIVRELVLPLMNDVLNDACRVACESRDESLKQVAWCLASIAQTYDVIGDYVTSARKSEEAVQFLLGELGEEASSYFIYAVCLAGVAVNNYKFEKYATALHYYKRAHAAFRNVTDWEDERDRYLFLYTTDKNIREIEKLIYGSDEGVTSPSIPGS